MTPSTPLPEQGGELRERLTDLLTSMNLYRHTEPDDRLVEFILADRKQHELEAEINILETIKMLNPHAGTMQVDSYDESDSGDAYVFITLSEKLAELKTEREALTNKEKE